MAKPLRECCIDRFTSDIEKIEHGWSRMNWYFTALQRQMKRNVTEGMLGRDNLLKDMMRSKLKLREEVESLVKEWFPVMVTNQKGLALSCASQTFIREIVVEDFRKVEKLFQECSTAEEKENYSSWADINLPLNTEQLFFTLTADAAAYMLQELLDIGI